jgi:hypothetical protein
MADFLSADDRAALEMHLRLIVGSGDALDRRASAPCNGTGKRGDNG